MNQRTHASYVKLNCCIVSLFFLLTNNVQAQVLSFFDSVIPECFADAEKDNVSRLMEKPHNNKVFQANLKNKFFLHREPAKYDILFKEKRLSIKVYPGDTISLSFETSGDEQWKCVSECKIVNLYDKQVDAQRHKYSFSVTDTLGQGRVFFYKIAGTKVVDTKILYLIN